MDNGKNFTTFNSLLENLVENKMKEVIDSYLLPRVRSMFERQEEPEYYTSKQLREDFGLSSSNLQQYRDKGLIEYVQIGRKIIYPREAVHDFLNKHTIKDRSS